MDLFVVVDVVNVGFHSTASVELYSVVNIVVVVELFVVCKFAVWISDVELVRCKYKTS